MTSPWCRVLVAERAPVQAERGRPPCALFRAAVSQMSVPSIGMILNPEWASARPNPVGRAKPILYCEL